VAEAEKKKLQEFDETAAKSPFAANRLLFQWLSDDIERPKLYHELQKAKRTLVFQSRADKKEHPTQDIDSDFQQDVYLLTARTDIERALTQLSNEPYRALGAGTFMLGLDAGDHDAQREFAREYLRYDEKIIAGLATLAFRAAAVLPLKQRSFDLAELAEQAALRFAGFLFGFAQADHFTLQETMRAAYRGLNNRIVGRHFVSELGNNIATNTAMAEALKRAAELVSLYSARVGRDDEDEYGRIDLEFEELRAFKDGDQQPLKNFEPVLRRIASQRMLKPGEKLEFSGTELGVIAVGLIAGTIGNVQAGVCIAINEFFRDNGRFDAAREAAKKSWLGDAAGDQVLAAMVWEALRLNPPATFLPRKTTAHTFKATGVDIPPHCNVILAMGAATRDPESYQKPDDFDAKRGPDPLVFGGPEGTSDFRHQCVGQHLAMPLILRIVRDVLMLESLTRTYDSRTGQLQGLEKLWGVMCRKYPLEYNRQDYLKQSPLIVIMRVKQPLAVHAEALKAVIKYGAPRIEKKLRDAKHVHFASFLFIENDSKLMLQTVYDRDFDSYIEHFALDIGPLFDRIFEHIEDAPPLPVNEFPKEFVDTIRRFNASPAAGYFFSAYPNAEVASIVETFRSEDP
jgi:cytochrome P450